MGRNCPKPSPFFPGIECGAIEISARGKSSANGGKTGPNPLRKALFVLCTLQPLPMEGPQLGAGFAKLVRPGPWYPQQNGAGVLLASLHGQNRGILPRTDTHLASSMIEPVVDPPPALFRGSHLATTGAKIWQICQQTQGNETFRTRPRRGFAVDRGGTQREESKWPKELEQPRAGASLLRAKKPT